MKTVWVLTRSEKIRPIVYLKLPSLDALSRDTGIKDKSCLAAVQSGERIILCLAKLEPEQSLEFELLEAIVTSSSLDQQQENDNEHQ